MSIVFNVIHNNSYSRHSNKNKDEGTTNVKYHNNNNNDTSAKS